MQCAKVSSLFLLFLISFPLVQSAAIADEAIRAADVEQFAKLARVVVQQPITETATKPLSEALDILLNASAAICRSSPAITPEQLMRRLEPFKRRLDPDKKAIGEMDAGWFRIESARQGSRRAIAVTMGAVSRLRVVDEANGQSIEVAKPMQWLYRYRQHPQFASDGGLLIISDSVQDAGVRVGLRIDLLRQAGKSYQVQQTIKRLFVLDNDFPALNGDRLVVRSVDTPQAILTSQADQHFSRIEEFEITGSGVRTVRTRVLDPELRAVDAWLLAARRTRFPDAIQALARKRITGGTLLNDCSLRPKGFDTVEATVEFDSAKFRFTLRKVDGAYRVLSVKSVS